jgi:hypothetical protein
MGKMTERKSAKLLVCYLAAAILAIGFFQNVYAGFAPSEVMNLGGIDRTEDLQKVQSILESKMVGERLKQLGFTAEEIKGKLAYLSDDQIHQLALQLDELKVGGFHGAIVLIAVVAIAAILLVALIPWHH